VYRIWLKILTFVCIRFQSLWLAGLVGIVSPVGIVDPFKLVSPLWIVDSFRFVSSFRVVDPLWLLALKWRFRK